MSVLDKIRQALGISANEALVDLYMERAIDLIRLEAGTRDKVWTLLKNLESDIVKSINDIDIRGVDAAGHQRNRLTKLLDIVRASTQASYRSANTLMGRELREVADIEGTWTANAINAATHAEFADSGITRGFLETLAIDVLIQGAPSKDWWGRQAAGLADRFADEMRRGVLLGENNSELVARVRGPGKIMDVSRTSAERLVRASVQTVANAAREETYANNTDLIASLQWHATLDTRTSIWCITRDGHQYTPVDHEPMDEGPAWLEGPGALHWGCRSTSVPILKSWKELGIDEAEVPKTTRASMDGQVPENLTFENWLKKQSISRQDTVLGKGKADLWRAGKITFRDLLDQNGRPLTTDELRAKAQPKRVFTPDAIMKEYGIDASVFEKTNVKTDGIVLQDLSTSEIDALYAYKNGEYMMLNSNLRTGKALSKAQQMLVEGLDSAIDNGRIDTPGLAFRGMRDLKPDSFIPKIGMIIDDLSGYLSISRDIKVASNFGGDLIFRIYLPKGATALSYLKASKAVKDTEQELILPRGSKFVVQSVQGRYVNLLLIED